MVHAPFSGERTFYCILKRARQKGLPIPDTIRDDGNDNGLIRLTAFNSRYRDVTEKRRIWESLFNFDRLQKNLGDNNARVGLGYGFKTDGHMISVLFEKDTRLFIPLMKQDVQHQSRGKDLTNWTRGIYPLYKNPTGITRNDSLIGIDPGILSCCFLLYLTFIYLFLFS